MADEKITKVGWITIAVLWLACWAFLGWGGWYLGRRAVRAEAIKAGHAKHVVVDEFGKSEFQWLEKGDK